MRNRAKVCRWRAQNRGGPSGGQSKEVPIDVFFKKILSVRDSLRVLELKIIITPNFSQEERLSFLPT